MWDYPLCVTSKNNTLNYFVKKRKKKKKINNCGRWADVAHGQAEMAREG